MIGFVPSGRDEILILSIIIVEYVAWIRRMERMVG